ncbi:MAG: hypothetical protein ACLP6G_05895 [Terriglobales bacterium]
MRYAKTVEARFVVCVRNEGYPAALELRKVYRVLVDEQASGRRLVRVVDESGEGYLYPRKWFVEVAHGARF